MGLFHACFFGTASAVVSSIVKSVWRFMSAMALLVAVLGASTIPAFALMSHPTCTAKHHECGRTPAIAKCCCGDEQSSPSNSTPAQSHVDVRADFAPIATVGILAAAPATAPHVPLAIKTSPPHQYLVDLPTLFASLLI
jgi:hypothetical protein